MAQNVLLGLQIFLGFCNVCIMLAIFKAFLLKPHNSLEERVKSLEVKIGEMQDSLHQGNDKFRALEGAKEIMLHSILALLEFEMEYCITEHKQVSDGLKKAKDDLNSYLARK